MKKVLILTVALIFVFSSMAFAGVSTSKHNMVTNANLGAVKDATTSGTTDQVCVFCHHPHRTGASVVNAQLLWNRNGQGNSASKYTTYASGLNAFSTILTGTTLGTNTGAHHTRLCLSCHDSTTAVSVVDTAPRGLTAGFATYSIATANQANIGGDANTLQNDHPVDFNYSDVQLENTEFPAPASGVITGSVTGNKYPLYGNDMMECGTCHDPHNNKTSAGVMFIRNADGAGAPLQGSQLCSDCHKNH